MFVSFLVIYFSAVARNTCGPRRKDLSMHFIFREYGKNAVECCNALTLSPWRLAKMWEAYCRFQILTPRSGSKAPPALDGARGPLDTFKTLVGYSGVARVGPWCLHPHLLSPKVSVVIHWPTLFHRIPILSTACPPALFVVGMLLPLIGRKSPAMAQIIYRGLLEQIETTMLEEISSRPGWVRDFESLPENRGVVKSQYSFEYSYYLAACEALSQDEIFIRACRNSFNATFAGWATVKSVEFLSRKYMQSGYVGEEGGDPYYRDCSIIRPGMVANPPTETAPAIVLKEARLQQQYGKRFRPNSKGIIGELLFAHDFVVPFPGEKPAEWKLRVVVLGATHYERDGKQYLVIDWGKWVEYRYLTTGTFFREDAVNAVLGENGFLKQMTVRREILSRKLRSIYAPGKNTIMSRPGEYPVPDNLLKAWDVASTLVDVIPVEFVEAKAYGEVAREFGWKGAVRRMNQTIQARKKNVQRAHLPLFFDLQLLSVGSATILSSMRGFHVGRTIYFQVPGFYGKEMFISSKGPPSQHKSKKLPRGISVYEKVYSFTAAYLEQHSHLFPTLSLDHLAQLKAFAGSSRAEIAQYVKLRSHRIAVGRPSKYTEAQDNAIITYYRPQIDEDARTALWTVCNGYTPAEISRRAKILQHKLIWEDGVMDTENLPHRRRT